MAKTIVMLATPFDNQQEGWSGGYYTQPKLDGVRVMAFIGADTVRLFTRAGLEVKRVPHIIADLKRIPVAEGRVIKLDGELYRHGTPFATISGLVNPNRVSLGADHEIVEFHVFDVDMDAPQHMRLALLAECFQQVEFQYVKLVPTRICLSTEEMRANLDEYVGGGYEGIILRERNGLYAPVRTSSVIKLKPRHTDFYKIVGCTQERAIDGSRKESIGAFLCEKDGIRFPVGTGPALTKQERAAWWVSKEKLERGMYMLEVKYLNKTAATDSLYQPVAVAVHLLNKSNLAK